MTRRRRRDRRLPQLFSAVRSTAMAGPGTLVLFTLLLLSSFLLLFSVLLLLGSLALAFLALVFLVVVDGNILKSELFPLADIPPREHRQIVNFAIATSGDDRINLNVWIARVIDKTRNVATFTAIDAEKLRATLVEVVKIEEIAAVGFVGTIGTLGGFFAGNDFTGVPSDKSSRLEGNRRAET